MKSKYNKGSASLSLYCKNLHAKVFSNLFNKNYES